VNIHVDKPQGDLAIVILSGGLDSTVLAYHTASLYRRLHLVGFDYGQKHKKELDSIESTAEKLDARWSIIDLTTLTDLLASSNSSLVDPSTPVPEGHYAAESMKSTVVPNRNSIMASIAYGIAVAEDAEIVSMGVHAGDHAIYPDCRPEWSTSFRQTMRLANEGFGNPALIFMTPFVNITKSQIVALGAVLEVPFEDTWSCYQGGEKHCGRCGTCVERKEAFVLAGVADPTIYEGK
jgi:7-cyano-7-deazaguanine synthase